MTLRPLLLGSLITASSYGAGVCDPAGFFERYQQAVAREISREMPARRPAAAVQQEMSPGLECEPPKGVFYRRAWVFVEGGDLDHIAKQAERYNDHQQMYPGLRQSRLCAADSAERFRFRYVNEVTVRFGILAVPVRATTLSEHTALHGVAGALRRWVKSASAFVDDLPKDLGADLCAAALKNDSKYLSRIETLWLFDRQPSGVFVTTDVAMLMKAGLNWFEQKALRDTLTKASDDTLKAFQARFRRK